MHKIVTFEELIEIERHSGSARHSHHDLRCFFCNKQFKAKDMLYILDVSDDVFIFRACSEECANLYLLQSIDYIGKTQGYV